MSFKEKDHRHILPGQRLPLERERKNFYGVISWEKLDKQIKENLNSNPNTLDFYKCNKRFFIGFYLARRDIAAGLSNERLNKFNAKYAQEDSPNYNPEYFTTGRPVIDLIRNSLSNKFR